METQKRADEQAKRILENRRVECMISLPIKMQFDSLLRNQHLLDVVPNVGDPDFFDEVPLYSRYKQVEFLKQYGDVNLWLVRLSLDYLNRVASEIHIPNAKRFVAITVISDDDDKYVVPAIFVCNSNVKQRLKSLHLSHPSEGLGKRVEALIAKTKLDTTFNVLEDRSTVPDDVRVFISHRSPPHGLVDLETLVNGAAQETTNGKS
jgi:hypothetical protein